MEKYTEQNKIAWEYSAYDFWVSQTGTPSERAKKDIENPRAMLKKYSKYFEEYPAWTNEKLPGEFTLIAYKA